MTTLALVAFLGLVAGVFAGLFGVGGGILFVPTLTLGLGLTQLHAEATSLLAIIPTALAGAVQQHRYGNARWRAAATIGLSAVVGVVAGAQIAVLCPSTSSSACSRLCCWSLRHRLSGARSNVLTSSHN